MDIRCTIAAILIQFSWNLDAREMHLRCNGDAIEIQLRVWRKKMRCYWETTEMQLEIPYIQLRFTSDADFM